MMLLLNCLFTLKKGCKYTELIKKRQNLLPVNEVDAQNNHHNTQHLGGINHFPVKNTPQNGYNRYQVCTAAGKNDPRLFYKYIIKYDRQSRPKNCQNGHIA